MSIRVMTMVWERSNQKGGALLVMLALADFSDDNGRSYPSVDTIAKKARMTPRNAQYVLDQLKAEGELEILLNAGPHGCNVYLILINRNLPLFPVDKRGEKIAPRDEAGGDGGVKNATERGEAHFTRTVRPVREPAAGDGRELTTGGAAAVLFFPSSFTPQQQRAATTYLDGHPRAQELLDEIEGINQSKGTRNTMGLMRHLYSEICTGTFLPQHAGRVAAERELAQVKTERAKKHVTDLERVALGET